MADFLGGLLSGGGGLYDDLLTPQQRDQLSSRGLLSMAGAFADAAMPSRFPVPLGAAIGKAAAAMSGGRDEAALKLLQGQKLSQEVQTMKMTADLQKQFMKDLQSLPLSELVKRYGSGAPAAATTAAPTTSPLPVTPDTAPLPAAPDAPAAPMFAMPPIPSIYGNPERQNLSPYTGLRPATPAAPPALLPMPPAPPGGRITPADYGAPNPPPDAGSTPTPDDPAAGASLDDRYRGVLALAGRSGGGASGSSLPPPDELIRQGSGPGGLLQASYTGAPPFGQVPGAGGDEVGSGGDTSSPEYLAKRARDLALVEKYESGGRNIEQQVVGPQGGYNPSVGRVTGPSSASGYRQMIDSTWRSAAGMAGIDTAQYPRAIDAPRDVQTLAAEALYDKRGLADWAPYNRALARAVGWSGPMGDGGGSGGGAAPGASGAPTVPVPPGVDPQAMNTLLLELAKRNAMAEILKLGNPYGSMLSVLQGSPAYQGQIETAKRGAGLPFIGPEEAAKRGAGLPFIGPETTARKGAEYPFDIATRTYQAGLDAANKEKEQIGAAARDLTTVNLPDANGNLIERQVTRAQAIDIAHGLPVPELGFKGMYGPGVGKRVLTPEETAAQQKRGEAPYTTKEMVLTFPDGETRKVEMTGEQAKDVLDGKAVPAIGWPGTGGGGRIGNTVYPPGYEKATEVMLTQRRPKAEAAVQALNFNETAQRLLDAGIISGWGSSIRLDVAKAKALFGWSNEQISNTEAFLATQARQVAAALASGAFGSGSSVTDNDRAYAATMTAANSNLDEASLRFLLRQNNTAARWEIDKYNNDVKRHDPKGQLPILRVDEGPKTEAKPSANQPKVIGSSKIGDKTYNKWSDGQWRPEGELPGAENR